MPGRQQHVGFGVVFQAEDGIRYLVRSRGLGDVYKRQDERPTHALVGRGAATRTTNPTGTWGKEREARLRDLSLIHI